MGTHQLPNYSQRKSSVFLLKWEILTSMQFDILIVAMKLKKLSQNLMNASSESLTLKSENSKNASVILANMSDDVNIFRTENAKSIRQDNCILTNKKKNFPRHSKLSKKTEIFTIQMIEKLTLIFLKVTNI